MSGVYASVIIPWIPCIHVLIMERENVIPSCASLNLPGNLLYGFPYPLSIFGLVTLTAHVRHMSFNPSIVSDVLFPQNIPYLLSLYPPSYKSKLLLLNMGYFRHFITMSNKCIVVCLYIELVVKNIQCDFEQIFLQERISFQPLFQSLNNF